MARCDCCVPIAGIRTTLNSIAPASAPSVFAANTRPTMRPGSWPGDTTAASAKGKLAPQRTVAGSSASRQRTKSIWKSIQGLFESVGAMGQ